MRHVALVTALCCLAPACSPVRCSRDIRWQHKDVAVITVHISEELEADDYRSIAERELARLPASPFATARPLHAVRCEFFVERPTDRTGALVAEVVFGGADDAAVFATPARVVLHPTP